MEDVEEEPVEQESLEPGFLHKAVLTTCFPQTASIMEGVH